MLNYPFNDYSSCVTWIESQKRFSPKVSLDNMKYFCSLLGNPEQKFKSIHVTGTNGKGSVVSYLKNILIEAGLNIGTFTSPYIIKFNERISFNRNMISDEEVVELAKKVYDIYALIDENHPKPSFFEFTTLMSFVYFSKKTNLDLAIIEVGIGGLLDSTNVITPLVSAISNVAYDHMNVLGNTLEEILMNKMGIIKPHIPSVIGIKDSILINEAQNYAYKLDSKLSLPFLNQIKITKADIYGSTFSYKDYKDLQISLMGDHQVENAVLAIEVIEAIKDKYHITLDNIKNGLLKTKWLGRLEILSEEPLIIVDGAHNIDGITRTTDFIKTLDYKTKRCIFACSDDKEKEKMISYLEPHFDEIIITAYTYKRHSDASILFSLSKHNNKILKLDIDEIIDDVLNNPYELNLFIGSLYFVSEVRPKILNKIN